MAPKKPLTDETADAVEETLEVAEVVDEAPVEVIEVAPVVVAPVVAAPVDEFVLSTVYRPNAR